MATAKNRKATTRAGARSKPAGTGRSAKTSNTRSTSTARKRGAAQRSAAQRSAAQRSAAQRSAARRAPESSFDPVRNVFLAGLGLYGVAFEEARQQIRERRAKLEQRREKATELFDELVKRGEKVENDTRRKLKQLELPELKVPELGLAGREEFQGELQGRLDKARDSFHMLLDAVSIKSGGA